MQITGHRGQVLAAGPPENTVEAVEAALVAGADGVEVDVRLSADGVPVCAHDATLLRIAGMPEQVRHLTYAELRRIRLADGCRIARLADIAEVVRGRGALFVEVKHDPRSAAHAGAAAMRVLAQAGLGGGADLVMSSFSGLVLDDVRRENPQARRALVTGPEVAAIVGLLDVLATGHHELHAHVRSVLCDHAVAERAHREGIALQCWTVNRGLDAGLLQIAGVSGVITDDPGALRTALDVGVSVASERVVSR